MRALPVPGRNGQRPSIALAATCITVMRSATVIEVGSPVEPPTEMPWLPWASCQSMSREIASRSSAPSALKGVTRGVIAPRIAVGSAACGFGVIAADHISFPAG